MAAQTPQVIGRWNTRVTPALTAAIDAIYRVFSDYEVPAELIAPEHREPLTLRQKLTAVPLRELSSEALGAYSGWAMTTVDGPDTYRHFLPRILEFALDYGFHMGFEPWVIAGKLDYGEWQTWPEAEQAAIRTFFQVAWDHTLDDDYSEPNWFIGIARAKIDTEQAFEIWRRRDTRGAHLKCAHVIGFDIGRVDGEVVIGDSVWDYVDIELRRRVTAWLLSPEMRARLVALVTNAPPEWEDRWICEQGIATWDRLTTVP